MGITDEVHHIKKPDVEDRVTKELETFDEKRAGEFMERAAKALQPKFTQLRGIACVFFYSYENGSQTHISYLNTRELEEGHAYRGISELGRKCAVSYGHKPPESRK